MSNARWIAGVDEAGRGPLAGPVVAAAVILDPQKGVASKCDLCGGEPQCVKYCPANVLRLTDATQFSRYRMKGYAKLLQSCDEKSNELEE